MKFKRLIAFILVLSMFSFYLQPITSFAETNSTIFYEDANYLPRYAEYDGVWLYYHVGENTYTFKFNENITQAACNTDYTLWVETEAKLIYFISYELEQDNMIAYKDLENAYLILDPYGYTTNHRLYDDPYNTYTLADYDAMLNNIAAFKTYNDDSYYIYQYSKAAHNPVVTTEASTVTTEAPVTTTEAPVVTTEVPVTTTEIPVVTTEVPVISTEAPVIATEAPIVTTEISVATETPVVTTQAPAIDNQNIISISPKAPVLKVSNSGNKIILKSNNEEIKSVIFKKKLSTLIYRKVTEKNVKNVYFTKKGTVIFLNKNNKLYYFKGLKKKLLASKVSCVKTKKKFATKYVLKKGKKVTIKI